MPRLITPSLPHTCAVLRRANVRDQDGTVDQAPAAIETGTACFLQPKRKSERTDAAAADRGDYDGECFLDPASVATDGDYLDITGVAGVALGRWDIKVMEDCCYLGILKRAKLMKVT